MTLKVPARGTHNRRGDFLRGDAVRNKINDSTYLNNSLRFAIEKIYIQRLSLGSATADGLIEFHLKI